VILEEFPVRSRGIMQAFVFNTRRDKFKDPRLRRAFNMAFDFEEMNKQMFFGQYTRINSYFEGTELASSGLPEGKELEILESVRDKVPPEVFTTVYTNPVGGDRDKVRNNLREATRLLREAGYEVRNQRLVNAKTGEAVTVEILAEDPNVERFILFYKPSLERLGVTVNARTVDSVQYENRMRTWDFDMTTASWPQSLSPGNEQRDYWGSQAADEEGSRNTLGIKNPVVDALVEEVIKAPDREALVARTRALDRVLQWGYYLIPHYHTDVSRVAYWDKYRRPEIAPKYGIGLDTWWVDPKAEQTIEAKKGEAQKGEAK
jgi:microcin C transport system substrate-binding protein